MDNAIEGAFLSILPLCIYRRGRFTDYAAATIKNNRERVDAQFQIPSVTVSDEVFLVKPHVLQKRSKKN